MSRYDAESPGGLDHVISHALWRAHHAVERALDDELKSVELTTSLVGALAFLAQDPGQSTADLARHAGVKPQSAARAVTRLEQLGLLTRGPHPVYRRVVRLHLTDKGHQTLTRAAAIAGRVEDELTEELDDRARHELLDNLALLRHRAEEHLGGHDTAFDDDQADIAT